MVYIKQCVIIGLMSVSPIVLANDLTPKAVNVSGKSITAQFDLSHLGQDCGLVVRWGDGSEQKIRVGRDVNEKDFTVTNSYTAADGYIFEVEGSTIKKGLGTVFGCQGMTFRKAICIGK